MSNLVFLRRCFAYRHAARVELHKARMLPRGPERNRARKLARALHDLARDEAWLEGQTLRTHPNDARFVISAVPHEQISRAQGSGKESDLAHGGAPGSSRFGHI
jgi:hypothetical protein